MSRKIWVRAFDLLGIVVVSLYLGYLLGSNSIQPGTTTPPSSGFLVKNLSIQPAQVQPNQIVNITVSVTNTHDTWGIYSLVLKINGVKEAEEQANVNAGSTQDISFSTTRKDPGTYSVFINGLNSSFTVRGVKNND
ncbi:MAG: hypothetical protein HYU85_08370 [Chloroflexi bacterium]|nr:hypothetical protein [Chloroflexota bacterium]MBI3040577.1 hypothetical protein [Chloroflexota bacterium]